jgi:phosphoserine phosphatase
VDFDGTIAPWGSLFGFPEPNPGAVEAIKRLKDAGYQVVIFTSRLSTVWHEAEGWDTNEATAKQVEYLQEYCRRYGIDADAATAEKIPAEAYFDDKAFGLTRTRNLKARVREFLDG